MSSVIRLQKLQNQVLKKADLALKTMVSVYSTSSHGQQLLSTVKSVIPPLHSTMHKGKCGRIGVVGGSKEYTGAPYFAAISALKVGADLSHIFCPEAAAPVIKSYSPDLIVHPILDKPDLMEEFKLKLTYNLHSLVIGPGLGRDTSMIDTVTKVLNIAMGINLPIVIDADGLFLILQNPDVIKNYQNAILTPNRIEFERLFEKVMNKKADKIKSIDETIELARVMGVTIVQKGEEDVITDGRSVVLCQQEGSPRRCGGQGDLLSGSMGTFAFWAYASAKEPKGTAACGEWTTNIVAAYAACLLTRQCSKAAFLNYQRAMVTENMIGCIGPVFHEYFEHKG